MEEKTLAIVGSRDFSDKLYFWEKMEEIKEKGLLNHINKIISGGCRGADEIAKMWARKKKYNFEEYKPDWSIGKRAGPLRNTKIVNNCDIIIAFPHSDPNKSIGTYDTIKKANSSNKHVIIFDDWDEINKL